MTSHRSPSGVGRSRAFALTALAALTFIGAIWVGSASFFATQSPGGPLSSPDALFTIQRPVTHENLAIYLVHGPATDGQDYITLDEGLAARTVSVREKGSRTGRDQAEVNSLEIENRSDKWLFLQAGDIVEGGKQDRTIMTDVVLAPHGGPQPLDAFCVEHGRWTPSRDGLAFSGNPGIVAGARLKRAIQSEKNQQRVWQEVAETEAKAVTTARAAGAPITVNFSGTGTYNAIGDNKVIGVRRDAYVAALLPHIRKDSKAIGLAVAVNGQVTAADVYTSPALFQRLSAKLLGSYALEALLARGAQQQLPAPGTKEVLAFLSKPAAANPSTERVGASVHRATRETDEAVMYEYGRIDGTPKGTPAVVVVHQSYLKK